MKSEWETKKLGEVFDKASSNVSINKIKEDDGKYPIYGAKGLIKSVSFYHQDRDYIAVIKDGAGVGRLSTHKACSSIIGTMQYLIPKDCLDFRFAYYLLLNVDFKKYLQGSTIPHIYFKDYKDKEMLIPDIKTQKRIVAMLDKVFKKISKAKENAEKNLKNVKEVFESYLQGVFENKGGGWEEKKLGDVCETGAGGTPLKSHKDYYENGTIPWLRSGEVCKKEIINVKLKITKKGLKNSSARLFPKNTVLVAMYGATAGQVGILRFESTTNQAICGILPSNKFVPEFLYYKFLSEKENLVKQAVGGAQPNISQIKIKNTFIPNLSIQTQKQIVSKLDLLSQQTKQLESVYTQKLQSLEELKQSILQKAFNGELTQEVLS